MTMWIDKESLIQLIEDAGLDVRLDYSGRGMFGKTCIGAEIADGDVLHALGEMVAGCEDVDTASDLLRHAHQDSMGRGTIIYWPRGVSE